MTPLRIIMLSYERGFLDPSSEASLRLNAITTEDVRVTAVLLPKLEKNQDRVDGQTHIAGFSGGVTRRMFRAFLFAWRETRAAKLRGERVVVTAQDPFVAGKLAFSLSRIANVPYEIQEHADHYSGYWEREIPVFNRILSLLGRIFLRRADAVRVVSAHVQDHLVRRCGVSADRITINPVVQNLSWHRAHEPRPWQDVPTIVVPCRFVHQKGLDVLLRALGDLKKQGKKFRVRLIGSGSLETKIRGWIHRFGLQEDVSIEQWASQESIWGDADLFVLSSRYEGWGRTIVEAMAARVPIVTTDVGCVGSFFRPQIDGRVVQPEDLRGLASAIKEQFEESDRRVWMVQNAYKHIDELPTAEDAIQLQRSSWQLAAGSWQIDKSGQQPAADSQQLPRRVWISTAALLLFASAIRLVSLLWFWPSLGGNREWGFFTLVHNWFLGNGFSFVAEVGCASAYRSPGFLFFLTGTYGAFGFENFLAQAIIQNIFAVLIVYVVYRLGWMVSKDRRVGLLAGFLIALHPYTFYHYTQYYHTFLSSFFLVVLMLALLKLEESKRLGWAIWSGVMIALLAYVQGTILPATVFLSIWLLIRWRKEWKRAIQAIAIMAVVSAGLIAPWTIRNYVVFHAFVPLTTDLGHALAKANNDHAYDMNRFGFPQEAVGEARDPASLTTVYEPLPEVEAEFALHGLTIPDGYFFHQPHPLEPALRDTCNKQHEMDEVAFNTYWSDKAKAWIAEHYWTDVWKLQAQKVIQFWTPTLQPVRRFGAAWSFGSESLIAKLAGWSLAGWVMLAELCAVVGLWIAHRKKLLGRVAPFLIVMGVYSFMHSFFAGYTKYRIPLDNLLVIIAAIAVVNIGSIIWKKWGSKQNHDQDT